MRIVDARTTESSREAHAIQSAIERVLQDGRVGQSARQSMIQHGVGDGMSAGSSPKRSAPGQEVRTRNYSRSSFRQPRAAAVIGSSGVESCAAGCLFEAEAEGELTLARDARRCRGSATACREFAWSPRWSERVPLCQLRSWRGRRCRISAACRNALRRPTGDHGLQPCSPAGAGSDRAGRCVGSPEATRIDGSRAITAAPHRDFVGRRAP